MLVDTLKGGRQSRPVTTYPMLRAGLLAAVLSLAPSCSGGDTSDTVARGEATVEQAAGSADLALAGRVTDAAGILAPATEEALARRLAELEARTGHQFVVVTTPSLGGEDIAAYSLRHANRWGIGRKGQDDGLLLMVAPNERQVRIEVGFGLERTLPDELCSAILQQHVLPRFRDGDLPGGVTAGVTSLIERLP